MTAGPEAGDRAPSFVLPTDEGGSVSLDELQGRKVVLYFYPKDDTSGCTRQALDFSALRGEYEAAGATIIGVSPDSVERHAKFRAKHELDVILCSDADKKVLQAYGVWKEKSMYGRKYMGVERSTFLIDGEGRIKRVWRNVKVPGHVEEVLAAVRAD